MDPNYTGHRPRVQMFHGDADTTIRYANHTEAIKEWTNVLGLSTDPSSSQTGLTLGTHQAKRQEWKNTCGYVVLDAFTSVGGDHGPSDCLFVSQYVIPFLGLDKTGAVDPEVEQCGSGGITDGGVGGASGTGGVSGADGGSKVDAVADSGVGSGGAGGTAGSGGSRDAGAGSGGSSGSGGTSSRGGAPGSGGSSGSGGSASGGASSANGGSPGSGGEAGSGGRSSAGGNSGSGSGGKSGSGGASSGSTVGGDTTPGGCNCAIGERDPQGPLAWVLTAGLALAALVRSRRKTL
jgi:MYXO-CTERM domain-containing protein